MPTPRKSVKPNAQIAVIGIDIGKNIFHLIGLDSRGAIVLKCKLARGQLQNRLANTPPCLIGKEACVGAHHLSRQLIALGHDARLMPAKYVKAFLKGNKNNFRDAEAIAEACSGQRCSLWRQRRPSNSIFKACIGCAPALLGSASHGE